RLAGSAKHLDRRLAERDHLPHVAELVEDAKALIEIEPDRRVRHALADLLAGRAADDVTVEETLGKNVIEDVDLHFGSPRVVDASAVAASVAISAGIAAAQNTRPTGVPREI